MHSRSLLVALCASASAHSLSATPLLKPQIKSPAQPPPPHLLKLRGGDGASAIQKLQGAYFGVPVVTRSWLSAILAFAALNQVGILPPELLQLDATATIKGMQIWRPITAGAFMGGLGPQLLQKCYYLIQFGSDLERTLGVGEFVRVLASCTACLCIFCVMLGWQFVTDGLVMALTVLTCQQSPNAQVTLYGLQIPCAYLPFAQMCMSYLFTQQIPWNDLLGAIVGYIHYLINDNCKPDSVIYKRDNYAAKAMAAIMPPGARTLGSSKPKGAGAKKKAGGARKGAAECGPEGCKL